VIRVPVDVAPRPYEVVVGPGIRHELADIVASVAPDAARAVIVTQQPLVDAGWIDQIDPGLPVEVVLIDQGEDAKTLAAIERLCRRFVSAGLSRQDLVIAVGGGLTSDVAGFAAATYHRGVDYLTVATSLLSQVDAAIGGKTGVNLPEGKNLVGAFWQPRAVVCDTEVLTSLPPREWACGRGEMAKYAFLGDGEPTTEILDEEISIQVARCAEIKADVVVDDEREGGRRMVLNYGHTLAHALEAEGLADREAGRATQAADLLHGEAVAIGLLFAAVLARNLGRIDDERVELHRRVVGGFDLSSDLPEGLGAEALVASMGRDKKAHHDLTFVLDGPNGVEPVRGVPVEVVLATLVEMGASR
jgi:5-deoxy-5-amino-3-dehydroquinate synthase